MNWMIWVNEPIFFDKGTTNIFKRKKAYYLFCVEGLIPFLRKYGYELYFDASKLTKCLLQVCYFMKKGKRIRGIPQDCEYHDEQYTLFNDTIDSIAWERFWEKWKYMQDFEDDRFQDSLRFQLSEFIWSWLNLNNSPASIKLQRDLDEYNENDEFFREVSKGKDDPYLQETSMRDYQDKHKH